MQKTIIAMLFLALAAGMMMAQTVGTSTPLPTPAPQLYITAVASNPRVGTTVPVGEVATISYRLRLSDGREITDITGMPFTIQALQMTGNMSWVDVSKELKCDLSIGKCTMTSIIPRIVTVSIMTPGLGNTLTTISFFRPNRSAFAIDVTASAAQANDGDVVTLSATSPITYSGWVQVHAQTNFTDTRESFDGYVYMPDGIKYGQKIQLNVEEVRPMSFRDRRYFTVTFEGANGIFAQGFGSSVGKMEASGLEASIDDNNDLVFTVLGSYQASVDYTATLLRNDGFRVELSTARNELFAYGAGSKTKLIFNKYSLNGNQFYMDPGLYTVNVQNRDRLSGIGFSQSRADVLSLERQITLQ